MSAATDARARQLRRYADHVAAVAAFRQRREADEQARTDALLLDVIDLLAGELMAGRYADECPECFHALGTRNRTCAHCHPRAAADAA